MNKLKQKAILIRYINILPLGKLLVMSGDVSSSPYVNKQNSPKAIKLTITVASTAIKILGYYSGFLVISRIGNIIPIPSYEYTEKPIILSQYSELMNVTLLPHPLFSILKML
jgi:hypothetical protein